MLATASALTTFFFFVELIGGYLAGSLAVMSDAAHLLSDLAGFVISLLALSISCLPASASMSFGFSRAEVLGAFVSILFIWALTIVLVIFAIHRIFHPSPVNGPLMLLLGGIGLGVNLLLGLVLGHSHSHQHGEDEFDEHVHDHDHAHSHQGGGEYGSRHEHVLSSSSRLVSSPILKTGSPVLPVNVDPSNSQDSPGELSLSNPVAESMAHDAEDNMPDDDDDNSDYEMNWARYLNGDAIESLNVRAAYLHVLGDALQNIGVIVAAVFITARPSWSIIDPICTLLFAAIVVLTTKNLARETFSVLMEGTPASFSLTEIHTALLEISNVTRVDDLHVWSLTGNQHALSAHLLVTGGNEEGHRVLKAAQRMLKDRFGPGLHSTIQVNCDLSKCCDDSRLMSDKNCVSSDTLSKQL